MTDLNTKLILSALNAIEAGPQRNRQPADYHVECFRRQCERDAALRELMEREPEPRWADPRSYEQYMEDECGDHRDRR
jgi:hypothetical protein